ncbi:hypothetical protein CR513_47077, partial [Mucuna pruriens]
MPRFGTSALGTLGDEAGYLRRSERRGELPDLTSNLRQQRLVLHSTKGEESINTAGGISYRTLGFPENTKWLDAWTRIGRVV